MQSCRRSRPRYRQARVVIDIGYGRENQDGIKDYGERAKIV